MCVNLMKIVHCTSFLCSKDAKKFEAVQVVERHRLGQGLEGEWVKTE